MDKVEVGIIGFGIVGSAMKHTFNGYANFHISDPKIQDSLTIKEVVEKSNYIFVCVPTPMRKNTGEIDCSIIDGVMEKIHTNLNSNNPIVIIKSTVIPSKLKEYSEKYSNMRLTMSPEYLTEKSYMHDALHLRSLVVGGNNKEDCDKVIELYLNHSNCETPFKYGTTDLVGAGVLKYMENCYLALKVTFMNQMYEVLKASGSKDSWDNVGKVFHLDTRMGNSHYTVPGPDGDFGWGGKCFPKDINAMIHYAKSLGVDIDIMEKSWEINKRIRKDQDWLRIEGAVS
jgi:UDPglucose 6-dehydrogenase